MAKSSATPKKAVERLTAPEEKQKALDNAIACIVKTYGEGSVMIMGSQKSKLKVEVVSTGSLGLDLALGIGGLPKGRIVEIFGPESGGKTTVSLQARLMSQAMRKLTAAISKSSTVAVFINQIREKIGVLYGNPETTPGGRALKFYASVRIEVRSGEQLKDGDKVIGRRTKCKVVKNKVAPPFTSCEFDMIFGEGISKIGEIIDMGVELDIIKKSGSWFSYQDMKIGQGKESVKKWLQENKDVLDEIEGKIRAQAEAVFKKQMSGDNAETEEESDNSEETEEKPAKKSAKSEDTEEKEAKPAKKTASKSKKKAVMDTESEFEEFSIEDEDEN